MKKSERISAIKRTNGMKGCAESHVKTLKKAYEEGHETVLVFEDDFEFEIDQKEVKTILTKFLNSHPNYNVFCLGRRLLSGKRLPTGFIEVSDCQTTSCYMVRRHFIPKLIEFGCAKSMQLSRFSAVNSIPFHESIQFRYLNLVQ